MNIDALFAGKPVPFGPRGAPSSIVKQPVSQITVHMHHTDEDEQGNKKLHGGSEKVLHQYSYDAYSKLQHYYNSDKFGPGTIGENLLVKGMKDHNVYIGDCYQLGQVVVQVSAPRAPCSKISHRYNIRYLDRFVAEQGICGWYYRIIQTGVIRIGDPVVLCDRVKQTLSVSELMKGLTNQDVAVASSALNIASLDIEWHNRCKKVLHQAQKKPQMRLF